MAFGALGVRVPCRICLRGFLSRVQGRLVVLGCIVFLNFKKRPDFVPCGFGILSLASGFGVPVVGSGLFVFLYSVLWSCSGFSFI